MEELISVTAGSSSTSSGRSVTLLTASRISRTTSSWFSSSMSTTTSMIDMFSIE
jgi:hypothetical protein